MYRAIYRCLVLGVSIVVFAIGMAWGDRTNILPVLALVVLAIGMVMPQFLLRFLWRDLLAGMRLLKRKNYAAAKLWSERFIAKVRKAPWLKHVRWLVAGSYSRDPEALALNNLGAAETRLGAFEAAQGHLEEAIALDPESPFPFYNMGVLCLQVGTFDEAKPWFEKAEALGLGYGWAEQMVRAAQSLCALAKGGVAGKRAADQWPSRSDLPPATGDYRVDLLNDDVTTMEFVIEVLEQIFDHNGAQALLTMLAVDQHGSGVAGRYDEPEAQARMEKAVARARAANFPLSLRIAADTPA